MLLPYFTYFFWKTKRGLELVSLSHFRHDFWRKYFSCYILLPEQISLSDCLYFVRYWAKCVFNCLLTRLWRKKLWSQPNLSNKSVFSMSPNSWDKNTNIWRLKSAIKMKYKAFFIIFKGLSLKQIKQLFLEGKSSTLRVISNIFLFHILSFLVCTLPRI